MSFILPFSLNFFSLSLECSMADQLEQLRLCWLKACMYVTLYLFKKRNMYLSRT